MSNSRINYTQIVLLAVLLLGFGYLMGTVQYDFSLFSFAQNSPSQQYEGPDNNVDKPEEAINTAVQIQDALHYAASKTRPAVVTIYTKKEVSAPGFRFNFGPNQERFKDFFEEFFPDRQSRQVQGLGSGVIIRKNGYILTNHHVVQKSDSIEVLLQNGNTADAELIASDKHTDLAILKIDRTGLPVAKFANSDDVKVGDWALAVGTPFQLQNSVNVGHISATHRSINFRRFEDLLQTDAPINKGNSGGPLIDIHGEVVGINTLILSKSGGSQGVGFAISSNLAKRTAEDLIQHGHVKRPWLGVVIQELTTEMSEHVDAEEGVIVAEVKNGSPADQAGLEPGDVIVEFNGDSVESPHDLQRKVLAESIDQEIELLVKKKEGEEKTVQAQLAELPTDEKESSKTSRSSDDTEESSSNLAAKLGMKITEISEDEAQEMGIVPPRPVVRIEGVQRGSAAQRAELKGGDIILRVGDKTIENTEQLNSIFSNLIDSGKSKVLLHVHRDQNFFTLLPLDPAQ